MKHFVIIIIAVTMGWTAAAQNQFAVPERTPEQMFNGVKFLMAYNVNVTINYAKSSGATVEEFAKYCGDTYTLVWSKDDGFEGFVTGTIGNSKNLFGQVKILQQSDSEVKLKVPHYFKEQLANELVPDVTYNEFITFFEISQNQVAEHMNASLSTKILDDGVEILIRKKNINF